MAFSSRRGSGAAAFVMFMVALVIVVAGVWMIGAGSNASNPCTVANPPSSCYVNIVGTSTGSSSSSSSSSTSTYSSATTNQYTSVTSLSSSSQYTSATFVSAIGYTAGIAGCNSPIGPYPSGCNIKNLAVSFTLDGVPEGTTPATLGVPSGQHTVICGAAPAGYVAFYTTITFTATSNTNYITCQYVTSSTTTSASKTTTTTGPSPTGSIAVDVNVEVETRYGNSMVSNDKITATWNGGSTSAYTGPNGEVAVLQIPVNAGQTTFTDAVYQRSAVYTIGISGFSFTLYYVVYLSAFNFLGISIDAGTVANIGYGLVIFGIIMAFSSTLLYREMGKAKGVRHG